MSEPLEFVVADGDSERLDLFLSSMMRETSRSKIKAWCKEGRVLVDDQPRKGSYTVHGGDRIWVDPPEEAPLDHIEPENIPLTILHEDDDIVVINKAAGMVVHPGAGVSSGTLANALAFHFEKLSSQGGALRPGIVHRLDKGTTGVMLVAKNNRAHADLSRQWQDGLVTKVYQALVWGVPDPPEGEVAEAIGRHPRQRHMMAAGVENGKSAVSRYKMIETFEEASKLNIHILTGRTHQIRVHLAHLGHPVVGDALYGRGRHRNLAKVFEAMPDRPMLHAALLRFRHPTTEETLTFKCEVPADFERCMTQLAQWP